MRSFTTSLTFMVIAVLLTLCAAAPLAEPSQDVASNVGSSINSTLPGTIPDDSTTNGTNINTANSCYAWDSSEKWKDVGGQHSTFVNQAVYDLCQLIAVEAYRGFHSGNTVSDTLSKHPASLLRPSVDTNNNA